jgi:polysaccharide biosynthesis/export protein PslD
MKRQQFRTMRTSRIINVSALTLVLGMAACSSVGTKKLPSPEEVMALQNAPVQRTEYRLMAGDKIFIKFPYQHAKDQELPVRPDGVISLDVTGEILAEGMTPLELAGVIKERSSRFLKNPEVVVVVTEIGARRVYVGGEVNRPGFVIIQEGMTPLQAVMAAGGFRDTAQKTDVLYVARAPSGVYNSSRVDLDDVVRNGTPEVVRLSGNEILFVPASRIANADLFVKQYVRDLLPVEARAGASAALPAVQ